MKRNAVPVPRFLPNGTFVQLAFGILLLSSVPAAVLANVSLPTILSDHAVLQKTSKVPIWGKADPGEKVTVHLGDSKEQTRTPASGKWRVNLDLHDKAQGPHELVVEGKNKIVVKDVLVGEVWLCSGQSNMEFTLDKTDHGKEDIASSANPLLRHFKVKGVSSLAPKDDVEGQWVLASPETAGHFTAVGYLFGRKLQQTLQQPVGLINATWGGSPCEAWTSREALNTNASLKDTTDWSFEEEISLPEKVRAFQKQYTAWESKYHRQDNPPANIREYLKPAEESQEWKKVTLPGNFALQGLPDTGAVWLQFKVLIPSEKSGQNVDLILGSIRGFEVVYWNGEKIGETTTAMPYKQTRKYKVDAERVKTGVNVLAMRVFTPDTGAAIEGTTRSFRAGQFSLSGEWMARTEFTFPALSEIGRTACPVQPRNIPGHQFLPSHLYNGMIQPLIPYAIRGVVWYQGEANGDRAWQYRTAFPLMINDWRTRWSQGDFPFYFCQLANYRPKKDAPQESTWAELREAQTSALSLKHTGQAILIDIGEEGDVHPRNKRDAAERLASVALANTYGVKIPFSGPIYQSFAIEKNQVRIRFTQTDGGLVAKPLPASYTPRTLAPETVVPLKRNTPKSELEGFAICGKDRQWKWANARIENDTVVVSSPEVPAPLAVRYAWADNPTCNLYNKAGLPAVPFRTDDFPPLTFHNIF
jgi:sialate O-acetylesterase